ncbi:hypothetical protein L1D14_04160 [Vibrio tubiashii]|uniref:hypothetical protein n=1 Tax=Vibrio tubiashii TaxID=29498 RepID=UPI001EFC7453|nr:hypothetical protein [Vibrio tubiashii]MCG9575425.1 hypothetical protein [Vibrio tubiashii]
MSRHEQDDLLTPNTQELIDSFFEYVSVMERETLEKYAKGFFELEHKIEELAKVVDSEDQIYIDTYFNSKILKSAVQNDDGVLSRITYLTFMLKHFLTLITIDEEVMHQLAHDDPGAYSKVLSYRKRRTGTSKHLGKYTRNILADYLKKDKQMFDKDHSHWFSICESKTLEARDNRVSPILPKLSTGMPTSK